MFPRVVEEWELHVLYVDSIRASMAETYPKSRWFYAFKHTNSNAVRGCMNLQEKCGTDSSASRDTDGDAGPANTSSHKACNLGRFSFLPRLQLLKPVVDEEPNKKLNWASFSVGEKRADDAPDVVDYTYGLVKFGDETKQISAMTEMNGSLCSTTPMRIRPATNKNAVDRQRYPKDNMEEMNHIAGHVRQMDGVLSQLTSTRNAKGINSEVTNVSSSVKNEKYGKRKATELGKLWPLGLQIKDAGTLAALNVIRLIMHSMSYD
ncbi:polyadenylate-binding protein RBP45-like protein [Tanacetum coccineum]